MFFYSRKILRPSHLWLSWLEDWKVILFHYQPQMKRYFIHILKISQAFSALQIQYHTFCKYFWNEYIAHTPCVITEFAPFLLQLPFRRRLPCSLKLQNQKDDNESDVSYFDSLQISLKTKKVSRKQTYTL